MIEDIFYLLKTSEHKGKSELIDIAKGKYKMPKSIKDVYRQFKRELAWVNKK